jgi:hypothetical protein
MALTPQTLRLDAMARRCGKGYVAAGKKCRKQGAFPTGKAIATGLGAAGLTAGAVALYMQSRRGGALANPLGVRNPYTSRLRGRSGPVLPGDRTTRVLPGDRTTRRLTGITPKGLLPPSPPPQSKTARMRANTGAAVRRAEASVAKTARTEVARIAQVGNTMALTGEATGMATKTTLRELRLRTEAARRRFEPGYRRGRRFQTPPQGQLPEGGTNAFQAPMGNPRQQPPASIPIDPRTGQPRRRRSRGFGRTDGLTPGKLAAW